MMLTQQQVKFEWTSVHHTAFLHLKEAIIQAPILHYPDPDKSTLSTLMPLMMCVGHNSPRNMMEQSSHLHFCHIPSQRHRGNGAQLNRRPTESTMQSLSGTTTNKVWTSLSRMIINHSHIPKWQKMLITRLTDGVWNWPHTISTLNGFQEHRTRQQIVSHD